jgi:hypothetical protein
VLAERKSAVIRSALLRISLAFLHFTNLPTRPLEPCSRGSGHTVCFSAWSFLAAPAQVQALRDLSCCLSLITTASSMSEFDPSQPAILHDAHLLAVAEGPWSSSNGSHAGKR